MNIKKILYVFAIFILSFVYSGCDMRYIVYFQQTSHEQLSESTKVAKEFNYENVKLSLLPIITNNLLKCKEDNKTNLQVLTCKTSPLSTIYLEVRNKNGETTITIEDTLTPLWIPQPFGKISEETKQIIAQEYGTEQVSCRSDFGLAIICEAWQKK